MARLTAGYYRVSTDDQSIDAQRRDVRLFAKARKLKLDREFSDEGYSGVKGERPGWTELWDLVQKGKVKTLIVPALDRIGRSLQNLIHIIQFCMDNDVKLISYRENLDFSTASGRLLAQIFCCFAEYERSLIQERTKAGIRAARARGAVIGNPRHYFDKRKATRLRDEGMGIIKIGRTLGVGTSTVQEWVRREYTGPLLRSPNLFA